MAGQLLRLAGPAFLANAAADVLTTPAAGLHNIIQHVQIVNVGAASTYSLYLGATGGSAAGTQVAGGTRAIAANDVHDIYFSPGLVMENTKYLSGVAADASRLSITVMGTKNVNTQ